MAIKWKHYFRIYCTFFLYRRVSKNKRRKPSKIKINKIKRKIFHQFDKFKRSFKRTLSKLSIFPTFCILFYQLRHVCIFGCAFYFLLPLLTKQVWRKVGSQVILWLFTMEHETGKKWRKLQKNWKKLHWGLELSQQESFLCLFYM